MGVGSSIHRLLGGGMSSLLHMSPLSASHALNVCVLYWSLVSFPTCHALFLLVFSCDIMILSGFSVLVGGLSYVSS